MSAYVVKNEVINRILSGLNYSGYGCSYGLWHLDYDWLKALKGAQGTKADRELLGHELYAVNVASVQYRYQDSPPDDLPGSIDLATGKSPAPYEYKSIPAPTIYQLHKDLDCWIYQSCESEATRNDPVYQAITDFKNLIANRLVENLREYAQASWD